MVLLHHEPWNENRARNSSAMGALVDAVVRLWTDKSANLTVIEDQGMAPRAFPTESKLAWRLTAHGFQPTDPPQGDGGGTDQALPEAHTPKTTSIIDVVDALGAADEPLTINRLREVLGTKSARQQRELRRVVVAAVEAGKIAAVEVVRRNRKRTGYRVTVLPNGEANGEIAETEMTENLKTIDGGIVVAPDAQPDMVLARIVGEMTDALDDHPLALPVLLALYAEGLGPDGIMDHPENAETTGAMLAEIWDHAASRASWLELARERVNEWAAECGVEETELRHRRRHGPVDGGGGMTAPASGKVIAVRQRIRGALDKLIHGAQREGDKELAGVLQEAYGRVRALQEQAEGPRH